MSIESFAQNFEDVRLWRALGGESRGAYVDVVASQDERHSVTQLFYDADWCGLNIQSAPQCADGLAARRPRDVTIHAVVGTSTVQTRERAVVDLSDEFRAVGPSRGTPVKIESSERSERRAPLVRLDRVLSENSLADIRFLRVAVHGAELDVLQTLNLSATRPWVILTQTPARTPPHDDRDTISAFLAEHAYSRVYFDGLNDFYLAEEHGDRLRPKFDIQVSVSHDSLTVADGRAVTVEVVGKEVDVDAPAQDPEGAEHAEALEGDGVRGETAERALGSQQVALAAALDAAQRDTADARTALERLRLTIEALEQASFERERLVAWYAQELSAARGRESRARDESDRYGKAARWNPAAHANYVRAGEVFVFVLWRLGLPFRILRRPRFYARLLLKR